MKRNLQAFTFFIGAASLLMPLRSQAAFTKLTDYIYDCEKPTPSKERILSVGADMYLDVFWQLFNDLRDQDYARESVGVTPEQSACIGNMKVVLSNLYRRAPASAKKRPEFFLRMGQYQAFNAQYKPAEESFRQAAAITPNSITVNVELARILERRGKRKDQEKFLRIAIAGQPKNDEEKEMLAEAYNKLVEAFEPDPKKAMVLVRNWLLLEPKSINARTAQADLGLELKEADTVAEAVGYLMSPDKEYYAGHAAYMKKDYKKAVEMFREYLKVDSREHDLDLENERYLVRALFESGEKEDARNEAEVALAHYSNDLELSQIHEKMVLEGGVLDSANPIKDLEAASAKNPRSRALKFRIIEVLLKDFPVKVDDSDPAVLRQALAYIDKILDATPDDIEATYWKAFVRYHARAFTDADITMSRVIAAMKEPKARAQMRVPVAKVYAVAANIKNALGYADEAKALMREGSKYSNKPSADSQANGAAKTSGQRTPRKKR